MKNCIDSQSILGQKKEKEELVKERTQTYTFAENAINATK